MPDNPPKPRPTRRRYQRLPVGDRPRFELTERDLGILALIDEHRFLRTPHILAVMANSEGARRRVRQRLRLLFDGGFLDIVRAPIDVRDCLGSKPNIYALGDAGADALAKRRGISRPRSCQRDKNREVGGGYLDHTLLTAELLIALERHARHRGDVRVIYGDEIASQTPGADRDERKRFEWKVTATWEHPKGREQIPVTVKPDKTFGLAYLDRPEGSNRTWFFVEADRGTETQIPSGDLRHPKKTTIFHKYLGFHATARQGLHTERLRFKGFRVLTVAIGRKRMENMMATAMIATGGFAPNQFLFTDSATLAAHAEDILALPWFTAAGETTTLRG